MANMVFNPPHPLILNWLFFLRRYVNVKDPHQAAAAHHDPAASSSPLTSAASEASSIRTLSSTAETSAGGFDTGNSAANGAINLSVDRPQQQQQQQQDSSGRAPPPGVLPQEPSEYLCTIEDFFCFCHLGIDCRYGGCTYSNSTTIFRRGNVF